MKPAVEKATHLGKKARKQIGCRATFRPRLPHRIILRAKSRAEEKSNTILAHAD
jgi:hypothetical protein